MITKKNNSQAPSMLDRKKLQKHLQQEGLARENRHASVSSHSQTKPCHIPCKQNPQGSIFRKSLGWTMRQLQRISQYPENRQTLAALRQRVKSESNSAQQKDTLPRIIVVTTFPVFPPQGGGQSRLFHLYRHLCHYADITLLTLSNDPKKIGAITIQPGLQEIRVLKSLKQQLKERWLGFQLNASVDDIVAIHHTGLTPEYGQILSALSKTADLIIISHPYLYSEVNAVWQGPTWYEAHNVEVDIKADILKDAIAKKNGPAHRALAEVTEAEALCYRDAQHILSVSKEDGQRLEKLYGPANITVVENGVDVDATPFMPMAKRHILKEKLGLSTRFTTLFMGAWHGPNIEATQHIQDIARLCPNIDFLIIGSVCKAVNQHKREANIHPLGLVTEAEKACLLGGVDVAINPMTSGSGTNLKMLDYTAAGLNILTTPFGNRGLLFMADIHLQQAEIKDFPDALQQIKKRKAESYKQQVTAARVIVEQQYSWETIADRLAQTLKLSLS